MDTSLKILCIVGSDKHTQATLPISFNSEPTPRHHDLNSFVSLFLHDPANEIITIVYNNTQPDSRSTVISSLEIFT